MSAGSSRVARRPLGEANLVSRAEARAELGCSWEAVDRVLAACSAYRVGRAPKYRWGDVLGSVTLATQPNKSRKPGLALVKDDWA